MGAPTLETACRRRRGGGRSCRPGSRWLRRAATSRGRSIQVRRVIRSTILERMSELVKHRRPYDSRRRRQLAEANRRNVLEAARDLLLVSGYAGTTIGAIADAASVSPETIYKAFGGKPGLVRAIWMQGLEGAGPVPAEQRSDAIR